MKRILSLIVAVIAVSVSSLYAQDVVRKTFDLGDFDAISASFIHSIHVTKGKSNKIEVTCPKQFADKLAYHISNGVLYLNMDIPVSKKNYRTDDGERIEVKVQMEEIKSLNLRGASDITVVGTYYNSGDFKLNMSGASDINGVLDINANTFSYNLIGASHASVKGVFHKIEGEVSGASELDIDANSATSVGIEASGASEVNYTGKTNSISVECSGASEVELEGSTVDIEIECSGASEVDAQEMIAENAKARASGASSIKVYANNRMELNASSASKIRYYGPAKELITSEQSISRGR